MLPPSIEEILSVDAEYLEKARADKLRKIAPRRFNPAGEAWLPILHSEREGRSYTVLFSNTQRAHQLGKTDDWVVIFYEMDGHEDQCTIVTRAPRCARRETRHSRARGCMPGVLPVSDYDAIVIGSGSGGLTAALALANAGRRVAVFEQHYLAGGYSQSFTLHGYRFSPGIHYIGQLGPGQTLRRIYEGLGVADDLEFFELNPDGYDRVVIGSERFDIPKGVDRFKQRLIERFPAERHGIEGYMATVSRLPMS